MHTPVGLLLDFDSGWSFPRHLYPDRLYRAWGNLPYEAQDHFIDGILNLPYAGYADASYFHDETGFLTATPYGDIVDRPLVSPFPLTPTARDALDAVLKAQRLFEVDPRLALITCRQGPGRYRLGILNNTWRELSLAIRSGCGDILELRELPPDCLEMGAVGYLPEIVSTNALGQNTTHTIAGGDVRIFAVRVAEIGVEEIPHQPPPPRAHGRVLTLRQPGAIKEAILARPTFFEHWDGVVVSWRYLSDREPGVLKKDAPIGRQGLRVAVDLAPGLNLYPDLRLIDNLPADYAASMSTLSNVVEKMSVLGAKELLFCLHRHPENNFTAEQTEAGFEATSLKGSVR